MAGLFAYFAVGIGFLALGALESLSPLVPSSSYLLRRFRFLAAAGLSSLCCIFFVYFSLASGGARDPLSASLPLSSLAVCALFLLYALAGIASHSSSPLLSPFPSPLLDLLLFFAFGQEFLLFYLRRKDLDGVENRYFALLLVPIAVCAISTLFAAARPTALPPRIARAAALFLHGTWLLQMGFSFFTSVIAHGCSLRARSRTDYTIRCRTHEDFHRGRAIATLQFNCHLAFLVVVGAVVYGLAVARMDGAQGYKPLSKELQMGEMPISSFTLDSDDDEEEIAGEEPNRIKRGHDDVVLFVPERNGATSH